MLRQWNRDAFIHARRDGAACMSAASDSPICAPAVSGRLLGCHANGARPDACQHATLLPTPGATRLPVAGVRSLCAAYRFLAVLDPTLVWERSRCLQGACSRLVSSNPTVNRDRFLLSSENLGRLCQRPVSPVNKNLQSRCKIPSGRYLSRNHRTILLPVCEIAEVGSVHALAQKCHNAEPLCHPVRTGIRKCGYKWATTIPNT